MPDLVVDHAYLSRTAAELEHLGFRLAGLTADLQGTPSLAVGAAAVFDELAEFSVAWAGAVGVLHAEAQHAAAFVSYVRETFAAADLAVAEAAVRAHRDRGDG